MSTVPAPDVAGIPKLPQKQTHSVQFPLEDVTILQNQSECPCGWFNWKELKNLRPALKLGQIVAAIVILALIKFRGRRGQADFDSFPEVPYVLLTFSAMIVTLLMWGDSLLKLRPLRRAFTPVLWFRVELWFTGLAAVMFYVLAYYVLIITFQYYGLQLNRVSASFGFVSAGLYLLDWWTLFYKRNETTQQMELEANEGPVYRSVN